MQLKESLDKLIVEHFEKHESILSTNERKKISVTHKKCE